MGGCSLCVNGRPVWMVVASNMWPEVLKSSRHMFLSLCVPFVWSRIVLVFFNLKPRYTYKVILVHIQSHCRLAGARDYQISLSRIDDGVGVESMQINMSKLSPPGSQVIRVCLQNTRSHSFPGQARPGQTPRTLPFALLDVKHLPPSLNEAGVKI